MGFIPGVVESFEPEGAGAAVHRDLNAGIVLRIDAFIEAERSACTVGEQNSYVAGRLAAAVEGQTRCSGMPVGVGPSTTI